MQGAAGRNRPARVRVLSNEVAETAIISNQQEGEEGTMKIMGTAIVVCALTAGVAMATPPPNSLSGQVLGQANKIQSTERSLASQLKDKHAQVTDLKSRVADVQKASDEIQQLINKMEARSSQWNAEQRKQVTELKKVAGLMNIFLKNEEDLAKQTDLAKVRSDLRAQSQAVELRAGMIAKTAESLGM
jgi:TolA-binding protein